MYRVVGGHRLAKMPAKKKPSSRVAAERRLEEVVGLVLVSSKGEIVADRDGWVKFWFSESQAKRDAKYLSQRLGVGLEVRQNSREFWGGRHIPHISVRGI